MVIKGHIFSFLANKAKKETSIIMARLFIAFG